MFPFKEVDNEDSKSEVVYFVGLNKLHLGVYLVCVVALLNEKGDPSLLPGVRKVKSRSEVFLVDYYLLIAGGLYDFGYSDTIKTILNKEILSFCMVHIEHKVLIDFSTWYNLVFRLVGLSPGVDILDGELQIGTLINAEGAHLLPVEKEEERLQHVESLRWVLRAKEINLEIISSNVTLDDQVVAYLLTVVVAFNLV